MSAYVFQFPPIIFVILFLIKPFTAFTCNFKCIIWVLSCIIVHNSYDSEFQQSTILLILGAHAQEGYSSCFVCLSVCLSVTTLAAASFSSTIKLRYAGLQLSILFIFNSWIFQKMLHSKVMASFAYRDRLRRYCSHPCFVFSDGGGF